jgi:hypothetical protein
MALARRATLGIPYYLTRFTKPLYQFRAVAQTTFGLPDKQLKATPRAGALSRSVSLPEG